MEKRAKEIENLATTLRFIKYVCNKSDCYSCAFGQESQYSTNGPCALISPPESWNVDAIIENMGYQRSRKEARKHE